MSDYLKDVEIDPDNLDMEWINQAPLRMRYGESLAKANSLRDIAKRSIDVVKAALGNEARGKLAKVTEAAVIAYILVHETYLNACDDYEQKKYEAELLQAAVIAIDTRKTSLENLVRLGLGGYFAMPSVPKDFPRAEIEKEVTSDREKTQRSKRKKKER